MTLRKACFTHGIWISALLPLLVAAGCGSDDFSGCEASRSCAAGGSSGSGGTGSGDAGGGGDSEAGASGDSGGEAGDGAVGGTGGTSGAGTSGGGPVAGAGGAPECVRDADCDDGDATNGAERCEDDSCEPGNAPPTVISVSPDDSDEGVEPDAQVTIEFSEALDPETVSADSIQVTVGDRSIAGDLSVSGATVTFTPAERYLLLGTHTVSVGTAVTDAGGAALLDAFESTFVVRDGAWTAIERLPSPRGATGPRVASDGSGNVLVAFSQPEGMNLRWYRPGQGWDAIETLSECGTCAGLSVAANRNGAAMGAYVEAGHVYARQYRNGAWEDEAVDVLDTNEASPLLSIAMSPTGEAHVVVGLSDGALLTRYTNASGVWLDEAQSSPDTRLYHEPVLLFDDTGNGMAVWGTDDPNLASRLVFSRFVASLGTWTARAEVRGSGAEGGVGVPSLAHDGNGGFFAAWSSYDSGGLALRTFMSEFSAASDWASGVPVSGTASTLGIFGPGIAYDGDRITIAWTETSASGGPPNVMSTRQYAVEAWEDPSPRNTLSGPVDYYWQPFLGADDAGNLMLVWRSATNQNNWDQIVWSKYRKGSGTWSDPAPVFSTLINLDDRDSTFVVAPSGVAAVAYYHQFENSNDRETVISFFE